VCHSLRRQKASPQSHCEGLVLRRRPLLDCHRSQNARQSRLEAPQSSPLQPLFNVIPSNPSRAGTLGNVGTSKSVGRIDPQTLLDPTPRLPFAQLYDRKNVLVAAICSTTGLLPFSEEHEIPIAACAHRSRARNTADRASTTSTKCIWQWRTSDHSRTQARHRQTNGICERFHRTFREEFYATAFSKKKLYIRWEELQADLDDWLAEYNRTRPHSGKYCYGETPRQTF